MCARWVGGVESETSGVPLMMLTNGNLKHPPSRGGCWWMNEGMRVRVVGGGELASDGVFKYVFGDAMAT